MAAQTFEDVLKFNPYHDARGRFASANSASAFTYAPGKSKAHDKAIAREKERSAGERTEKGFKGTLYHGSPATDIEEFNLDLAGSNTSSGERLLFFTDSKQMAEDFSYERLEGSTGVTNARGKKGRVYEVEVEIKNPLDFRNLSDTDIDNILQLDMDGLLTKDMVKQLSSNHQLLKTSLDLRAERLKALGYDGLIANTGKAGHNSTEYAVVSSKQAKITKSVTDTAFDTIVEVGKFNPYHDAKGRFTTAGTATSFTHRTKDPNKQHLADRAKEREKQRASSDGEDESPRMKTIHSIEDKIRNQNYESSAVVDKDGNVILTKDGNNNSVSYTRAEAELMQGNTLTHNHPRSSMFSDEDIQFFSKNNLEEIRATNREGITYSIRRGEGYTNADGVVFSLEYSINSGLARQAAQRDLDNRGFQRKIARGEITPEQANIEFGKVVNRELANFCEKKAPEYNLVFSIDKRDVTKSVAAPYANIAKSADVGDGEFVLDRETDEKNDAAFNEWLDRTLKKQTGKSDTIYSFNAQTQKSMKDSRAVLFVGLQISGADSLAIAGGENPEDFHITLAYGTFDTHGHDEDDIASRVQIAVDQVKVGIPDTIHFDAIGRFAASKSSDGKDVIYAQVAPGQLEKAHDFLLSMLKEEGIELEATFPDYKPHMTLAYIDPGTEYKLGKIDATGTTTQLMIGQGWDSSHENEYTITKIDEDKRLVFGWASVSITVDGEQVEDRQHDLIDPEDLEAAVYEYVLNFRDSGEEHIPTLRKKGKLVESCVFTEEKQKAMGIPDGVLPIGWWIGFKIEDDAAWEKVKNGTYKMFSIEGKAHREPVQKSVHDVHRVAKTFDQIIEIESREFP